MIPVPAYNVNRLKSHFRAELGRHYTKKWLQEINDREQNPILRTCAIFKEKKHCLENNIQCLSLKNISKHSFVSVSVTTDLALNWGDTVNTYCIFLLSVNSIPTPEDVSTRPYTKIYLISKVQLVTINSGLS